MKITSHSTTFFFNVLILFSAALGLLQAIKNSINMSIQNEETRSCDPALNWHGHRRIETGFMWEATAYSILPIVLSLPVSFVTTPIFKLLLKKPFSAYCIKMDTM